MAALTKQVGVVPAANNSGWVGSASAQEQIHYLFHVKTILKR